jgi:hypothetical protein
LRVTGNDGRRAFSAFKVKNYVYRIKNPATAFYTPPGRFFPGMGQAHLGYPVKSGAGYRPRDSLLFTSQTKDYSKDTGTLQKKTICN